MANIQNQQMRLNISSENLQQYAQQSRILKEIERNKKQKKNNAVYTVLWGCVPIEIWTMWYLAQNVKSKNNCSFVANQTIVHSARNVSHTQNMCRVTYVQSLWKIRLDRCVSEWAERTSDQTWMCAHILDNLKCRMSDTNNVL